jgi:preprotein translocase subunit SecG
MSLMIPRSGTSVKVFGGNIIMEIVLGILVIFFSVLLTTFVLMQSGKDKQLSGSIAGGADTFFGKQKAGTLDKILSRLTPVIAVIFTILVIVMYLFV